MFGFKYFINFLVENKIHGLIIGNILANGAFELTNSILNNIFVPLINVDMNYDGKSDIETISNKSIKIFNSKIRYGRVIISVIKIILVSYILFIITICISKIMNIYG
jgi:large-conductance mechanosensitive channel